MRISFDYSLLSVRAQTKVIFAELDDMRSILDALMTKDDEDVDIEKSILKSDPDCFRAGELYKKLNLFESVVLSLEAKGFR